MWKDQNKFQQARCNRIWFALIIFLRAIANQIELQNIAS